MLVLARRADESIVIDLTDFEIDPDNREANLIKIHVCDLLRYFVRIGIDADKSIKIVRTELWRRGAKERARLDAERKAEKEKQKNESESS